MRRRPSAAAGRRPVAALFTASSLSGGVAMAIDLAPLWDFSRPDESERRLQAALQTATGDDALILRTQIARSHGLRRDFDTARRQLRAMEAAVATAGPEVRARHALELGRTWASAAHPPEALTPEAKAQATQAYDRALAAARAGGLDALAVDVIHMRAFVDTAPADQLRHGQEALAIVLASTQPAARRWEASIRNNLGVALNQLGRHAEALDQLQQALALRERGSDAQAIHVARWMVAHTQRLLGRHDEALQTQRALAAAGDASGQPDPYVFEELEALERARGDAAAAAHWAARRQALAAR
jgi:tetratricopeptide (TPR) repeat protein